MTDRITFSLHEPVQAKQGFNAAWMHTKALLMAGHRLTLEVRPEKRSDAQNRLLHATLTVISQRLDWAGTKRDVDTWKRLLTAAWLRTRGENVEMLPAVDGKGYDIVFRRTSTLTKAECAELSEFIMEWATSQGVYIA